MDILVKGLKVELTKQDSGMVIRFGAGWKPNAGNSGKFDIDLAATAVDAEDKILGKLYFGKQDLLGMKHSGDNLDGEGDGEDEFFKFDVSKIDPKVSKVFVYANIFDATGRRQNFGQVKDCYLQATDEVSKVTLSKFDLSEDFSGFTGVVLGKIYRHNDAWKFEAIGKGVNGDLNQIEAGLLSL